MTEELKLPDGLQLAVKLLAQVGSNESDLAIEVVRTEHELAVSLQRLAETRAQRIADLIRESEARIPEMQAALQERIELAKRVRDLEAEVRRLSPSAGEIEYTAGQNWSGLSGAVAWHLADRHGDGWAGIGDMMEAWRDAEVKRITAALATTLPAAPEKPVPVLLTDEQIAHEFYPFGADEDDIESAVLRGRAIEQAVLAANGLGVGK